jgi:hypothetical protein
VTSDQFAGCGIGLCASDFGLPDNLRHLCNLRIALPNLGVLGGHHMFD